jgi:hypothetical protein
MGVKAPTEQLPGRVLKVLPGDPRSFQTIGEAEAAARQFDTIAISPEGNPYRECVAIHRRFDLRVTSGGSGRAVIDPTGACPSSQPAFSIAESRHVSIENVDLVGNGHAGPGFFVDLAGDARFLRVSASGFGGCGLLTSLSVVGVTVRDSRFTDNAAGGLCLNGNGFWITGASTDRNGTGGIVLQGASGGVAANAFVSNYHAGPDQGAGITHTAAGGLHNVFVSRSIFGEPGAAPQPGADGISGTGAHLEVSLSSFHGMGIDVDAGGVLTRNTVSGCEGSGFVVGPAPAAMTLASNAALGCAGTGFDLTNAFGMGNRAVGNAGGGFLARDGVFLYRNTAAGNGGPGFDRASTRNGGRLNRSTDSVPADFQ